MNNAMRKFTAERTRGIACHNADEASGSCREALALADNALLWDDVSQLRSIRQSQVGRLLGDDHGRCLSQLLQHAGADGSRVPRDAVMTFALYAPGRSTVKHATQLWRRAFARLQQGPVRAILQMRDDADAKEIELNVDRYSHVSLPPAAMTNDLRRLWDDLHYIYMDPKQEAVDSLFFEKRVANCRSFVRHSATALRKANVAVKVSRGVIVAPPFAIDHTWISIASDTSPLFVVEPLLARLMAPNLGFEERLLLGAQFGALFVPYAQLRERCCGGEAPRVVCATFATRGLGPHDAA